MTTRRSFFKGFAAIVAAVALAPEIVFQLKPLAANWRLTSVFTQTFREAYCFSDEYMKFIMATHELMGEAGHGLNIQTSREQRAAFVNKFFWGSNAG